MSGLFHLKLCLAIASILLHMIGFPFFMAEQYSIVAVYYIFKFVYLVLAPRLIPYLVYCNYYISKIWWGRYLRYYFTVFEYIASGGIAGLYSSSVFITGCTNLQSNLQYKIIPPSLRPR